MAKIWSVSKDDSNKELHELCFNTNIQNDNTLIQYDIRGLIAHCEMLGECGFLSLEESGKIVQALKDMETDAEKGDFSMTAEWEDCHSLIEAELIKRCGEIGKKLYMARSRNDQIISATRLYTLDKVKHINGSLKTLMEVLLGVSRKFEFIPMPGYTHTQRAMPSSFGLWASSFLEILLDQKEMIKAGYNLNNVNTLGSAAGYGTSFKIDREMVTRKLKLGRTLLNSLACQLSRGQVECQTLQSYWGVMFVLNRISNDIVWFTSNEFDFFKVDDNCTTGSSIMPNKKNVDACEIVRARYHVFCGYIEQIKGIVANLFSGYNSDFQETKPLFFKALNIVESSIRIITIILSNLSIKESNMEKALTPDIYATDVVNSKVLEGMTFRDAYIYIKKNMDSLQKEDALGNLKSKTHLGAPGNIGLDIMEKRLGEWDVSV